MSQSLHQLISERGFDCYRPGLESRFAAHHLSFTIHYSEGATIPSLMVRLENQQRLGELCVRESAHCDLTATSVSDGQFRDRHVVLESADGFHEQLAALFLYIAKGEWTHVAS